jgi:Flp pilus assembly protein TadD
VGKKRRRVDDRSNSSGPGKMDSRGKFAGSLGLMGEVLKLSFLAILVFLIYSNTLEGPFIFDDMNNIVENPHIRLTRLTLKDITRAGLESPSSRRPVANISFALNYYFSGYNVLGYRLVNILIHFMTGVLLYLFAKTTLEVSSLSTRYKFQGWVPFFTALIWLVHPIQSQSVTYIVQRMNSMAGMFYILSLLLYATARRGRDTRKKWVLFAGCILSGILSLGSKQIAATLPFVIFLYEWYFFQNLSWGWLRRQLLPLAAILMFFAAAAYNYLGGHPLEKILLAYEARDFTLTERVLTEFRVVIYYISLLLFPHPSRLNLDYDFPMSHSLIDPLTTVLCLSIITGLIALAFGLAKKERLLSFAILWFFGNLVIESSVIGLEIIFEHRTYLPSMLVSMAAVTLSYRYLKPKWLNLVVLCVVAILFSFWTYERNGIWRDDVTLWKDCVKKSPNKARPHNNLANALFRRGKVDEAVSQYTEALRIKPNFVNAHNNLGIALGKQGKLDRALSHFSEALRIEPDNPKTHNNLGNALVRRGKVDEAVSQYTEALRIKPNFVDAHINLGIALGKQGKLDRAISHFSEALRIEPDNAKTHNNLGFALAIQGRVKEASSHYFEALQAKPDYAEAHNNLGVALAKQRRLKEAMSHFSEALRIKPYFAEARNNMDRALLKMKRSTGAPKTILRPLTPTSK